MRRLGTETAFEVLVQARALEAKGRDIVHLEIGEPDFDTPENVIEAGVAALRGGWTHYGPSAGLPQLRQAIAEDAGRRRGVEVNPEEVVVVPGAKPILFFVMLALVGEGDEVLYPNPGFPIYESMIEFAGGRAVPLQLREDREFRLDVREMAEKMTPRTRLIIINSPANPTGGVLSEADIRDVADAIGDRNILLLSDEIYSQLLFEGSHFSPLALPEMRERTILLDGFSKTYAMTGWRLGYGVMRRDLGAQIARLMTNSNSCTASFTQMAGVEALRGPQESVTRMCEAFRERRDLVVRRLNRIRGFRCLPPKGAFYVFPNIQGTGWSSRDLAHALLEEAGVACLSGTAFGRFGEGYLRFSIANSKENLEKALDRVEEWAEKRVSGAE